MIRRRTTAAKTWAYFAGKYVANRPRPRRRDFSAFTRTRRRGKIVAKETVAELRNTFIGQVKLAFSFSQGHNVGKSPVSHRWIRWRRWPGVGLRLARSHPWPAPSVSVPAGTDQSESQGPDPGESKERPRQGRLNIPQDGGALADPLRTAFRPAGDNSRQPGTRPGLLGAQPEIALERDRHYLRRRPSLRGPPRPFQKIRLGRG